MRLRMQNPRHEGRIRRKHVDECHYDGEKRRAHVLNVSYFIGGVSSVGVCKG